MIGVVECGFSKVDKEKKKKRKIGPLLLLAFAFLLPCLSSGCATHPQYEHTLHSSNGSDARIARETEAIRRRASCGVRSSARAELEPFPLRAARSIEIDWKSIDLLVGTGTGTESFGLLRLLLFASATAFNG